MREDKNKTKKMSFWQSLMQDIKEIEEWQKGWQKQHSSKQCPRCDSKNLNSVKPSLWTQYKDASMQLTTLGIRKPTKPLNVCRDCGFSWEDR